MSAKLTPVESYLKVDSSTRNYSFEAIDPEDSLTIYRSPLAYGPTIILFFALFFAGIYVMFQHPETIQSIDTGWFSFSLPLSGLPAIVIGFVLLHKLFDGKYVISKQFIRGTEGLMSLRKDDVIVELAHIRGIEIHRSLYGRIANTGDLAIGTAAQEDEEITMHGVYNPSRLRDIILEKRERLHEAPENKNQEDE